MNFQKVAMASLILRLGLAFVFFFAAATSLLDPESYYRFVPSTVTQFISIKLFLMVYGIFEILLGLWLLIGRAVFFSGMVAAILLFTLTVSNLSEINVLFRNVAIICAALALVVLSRE